jgi:hypothetical protein
MKRMTLRPETRKRPLRKPMRIKRRKKSKLRPTVKRPPRSSLRLSPLSKQLRGLRNLT